MLRFFDLIFSFFGLIILSPIFLIIAVFILFDSKGGIFYRQTRVGKNGVDFKLYKFRTMAIGSDKGSLITIGGKDSRITKAGYFLRKYKLDELPQLINVLKGDMSLVGPRPEVRKYVDLYAEEQRKVLSIVPGITDYASIVVDVNPGDFNISIENIRQAITHHTKAIMPVDLGGMPCDYDELFTLAEEKKSLFIPDTLEQQQLGRILILSDSAHSIGAKYKGRKAGNLADISVFSFHAVKNLTTAEGGAIALNLPQPFDNEEIYKYLNTFTLHGQNKDALAKTQKGAWRYDVITSGYKGNMTDILASIGLIELERYDSDILKARKYIFDRYTKAFEQYAWAELPVYETGNKTSSYHLYCLRIKNISEHQRDMIIQKIFDKDVCVNVHYRPLPLLTAFQTKSYKMSDYPVAWNNYSREITLPVWYGMTDEMINRVIAAVISAVEAIAN